MADDSDNTLAHDLSMLETQSEALVPHLRVALHDLRSAAATTVRRISVPRTDYFGRMALYFHAKQIEHSTAILTLDGHPDSTLVARSMLEGLCLLKWARADEAERALMWHAFSLVIDWRRLKAEELSGHSIDEAHRSSLNERLATEGHRFLTDAALKASAASADLPADPYRRTWYVGTLKDIFAAVGGSLLYDGPYKHMSDWHHWNPAGLAQGMWSRDDAFGFDAKSPTIAAGAFSNGFQALAETALVVTEHFSLDSAPIDQLIVTVEKAARAVGYGQDS
jgi:hypothetical protein